MVTGPLDERVQVGLVDHAAGQHRGARDPIHLHPFEQEARRFAQVAAEN
jgi:hypothetical protein